MIRNVLIPIWALFAFFHLGDDFARCSRPARMSTPGSKWSLARSRAHFLERASKVKTQALLLCTEAELTDQDWIAFFCWADSKESIITVTS